MHVAFVLGCAAWCLTNFSRCSNYFESLASSDLLSLDFKRTEEVPYTCLLRLFFPFLSSSHLLSLDPRSSCLFLQSCADVCSTLYILSTINPRPVPLSPPATRSLAKR
ncbi:hypothetical protein H2248_010408 [Termitomyces sp. 'cryptogamus']|nr:hypothetical protein H2248_010408 [Termitomyces sp. 'cryptogamus']